MSNDTRDLQIQAENASGSPQRWRVLITTFLSYFYDSYDLIILSISMPVILEVLDIDLAQGGLLSSFSMVGALVGSMVMGVIAENRGRKFALVLSLIWFGVATLPVIFITHFGSWIVLRFICGVGIGGVWGPCVALLTKHWKAKYRARANSFMLSTFALGGIAAALLGRMVLTVDWRYLFLIGTTSIVVAIIALYTIPADEKTEKSADPEAAKKERIGLGVLFQPDVVRFTVFGTLIQIVNMGGYWGVNSWIPTYLKTERGLSTELMTNFTLVMYVGMFIGYQVWSNLADRIGRKRVIMICFIFDAASVLLYLIMPDALLFGWGAVVGFGFGGIFGVQGAFYGELFPDRFRALGGGFCFNVGRIGSIIAPYTVGVIGNTYGLQTGLSFTPVLFGLGVLFAAFLPETLKRESALQK